MRGPRVGVTARRDGLSTAQRNPVGYELHALGPSIVVHGDCLGGDYDVDCICIELGIPRGVRPCTLEDMRAHCERRGARVLAEPKPPMQRNRDIVADVDVLIGCPPNDVPLKRGSGTWATIRYGRRKAGMLVVVVFPDGRVERCES